MRQNLRTIEALQSVLCKAMMHPNYPFTFINLKKKKIVKHHTGLHNILMMNLSVLHSTLSPQCIQENSLPHKLLGCLPVPTRCIEGHYTLKKGE